MTTSLRVTSHSLSRSKRLSGLDGTFQTVTNMPLSVAVVGSIPRSMAASTKCFGIGNEMRWLRFRHSLALMYSARSSLSVRSLASSMGTLYNLFLFMRKSLHEYFGRNRLAIERRSHGEGSAPTVLVAGHGAIPGLAASVPERPDDIVRVDPKKGHLLDVPSLSRVGDNGRL